MLHRLAKHVRDGLIRRGAASVSPRIIRTLPHATDSFTQGLVFHAGVLYESTGLYGRSSVRVIDPRDGRLIDSKPVSNDFSEGIAVRDGELYQLSWKQGIARVYDLESLEVRRTISYQGEGWGLTSHDGGFFMSDGTSRLQARCGQFDLLERFRVRTGAVPMRNLNDLQYANGLIYANVLWRNDLLEIDPATGRVHRLIDCSEMVRAAAVNDVDSVFNGVAYNPKSASFFLTGKNWPLLFEVVVPGVGGEAVNSTAAR